MTKIVLPAEYITPLVQARKAIAEHWKCTGLEFTLDGKLIGDIAEAVAADAFQLKFPHEIGKKRCNGIDLYTNRGEGVQVKASQDSTKGPAYTGLDSKAKYLIFLRLDLEDNNPSAIVLFNGLEKPVLEWLSKKYPKGINGTVRVALDVLKAMGQNDCLEKKK